MPRSALAVLVALIVSFGASGQPMDEAPWWKSRQAMELALREDPDVLRRPHRFGRTGLHVAAERGDPALVAAILDHKIDPDVRDDAGSTPLIAAVLGAGRVQSIARYRLRSDHNESHEPRRFLEVLKLLLARGADVNGATRHGLTALRQPSGFQAHSWSRGCSMPAQIRSVNETGNEAETVIETAVRARSPEVVRMLLARGAKVQFDARRNHILASAAAVGSPNILHQMMAAGADFSHRMTTQVRAITHC